MRCSRWMQICGLIHKKGIFSTSKIKDQWKKVRNWTERLKDTASQEKKIRAETNKTYLCEQPTENYRELSRTSLPNCCHFCLGQSKRSEKKILFEDRILTQAIFYNHIKVKTAVLCYLCRKTNNDIILVGILVTLHTYESTLSVFE